jgi:isocitrate dehydrogenase
MMVFEATHGSAPKYAGQDIANPIALTLAARLMLEQIGWTKAAELIYAGIAEAIKGKAVTPDLARQMSGAREVGTSEFADIVIESIKNIKIAD